MAMYDRDYLMTALRDEFWQRYRGEELLPEASKRYTKVATDATKHLPDDFVLAGEKAVDEWLEENLPKLFELAGVQAKKVPTYRY